MSEGARLVSTFTFALMVGLSVGDTTLGTLVANLRYDKPVMPEPLFGDTLRAETEIAELKPSKSRPGAGIHLINQRDEVVRQCLRMALVKRSGA